MPAGTPGTVKLCVPPRQSRGISQRISERVPGEGGDHHFTGPTGHLGSYARWREGRAPQTIPARQRPNLRAPPLFLYRERLK